MNADSETPEAKRLRDKKLEQKLEPSLQPDKEKATDHPFLTQLRNLNAQLSDILSEASSTQQSSESFPFLDLIQLLLNDAKEEERLSARERDHEQALNSIKESYETDRKTKKNTEKAQLRTNVRLIQEHWVRECFAMLLSEVREEIKAHQQNRASDEPSDIWGKEDVLNILKKAIHTVHQNVKDISEEDDEDSLLQRFNTNQQQEAAEKEIDEAIEQDEENERMRAEEKRNTNEQTEHSPPPTIPSELPLEKEPSPEPPSELSSEKEPSPQPPSELPLEKEPSPEPSSELSSEKEPSPEPPSERSADPDSRENDITINDTQNETPIPDNDAGD